MVSVGAALICSNPRAVFCVAVDQAWEARTFKCRQVFDRPVLCGSKLSRARPARVTLGSFAQLAEHLLLPERGRRNVLKPRRIERDDETGSGPCCGVRDGHLVPFDQYWRMARGQGGVDVQLDAPA